MEDVRPTIWEGSSKKRMAKWVYIFPNAQQSFRCKGPGDRHVFTKCVDVSTSVHKRSRVFASGRRCQKVARVAVLFRRARNVQLRLAKCCFRCACAQIVAFTAVAFWMVTCGCRASRSTWESRALNCVAGSTLERVSPKTNLCARRCASEGHVLISWQAQHFGADIS